MLVREDSVETIVSLANNSSHPQTLLKMNAILQEALIGTQNIQHAAIIRRKDAVIRAKSASFNVI